MDDRRAFLRKTGLLGCSMAAASLAAAAGTDGGERTEAKPGSFAVQNFGAMGDGTGDETVAFQKALDAAGAAGCGIVFVPAGRYRLEGRLSVPESVTLQGIGRAPSFSHMGPTTGSILLTLHGKGDAGAKPFITLANNATLEGLVIFHPEQVASEQPLPYPWTVASAEGGVTNPAIVNVHMVNPYQAVDFGSYSAHRHFISGLYADILYRGIWVDGCGDCGRIENVQFWPFWDMDMNKPLRRFTLENAEGMIFGRTDWELVSNCFVLGLKTGYRFTTRAQFLNGEKQEMGGPPGPNVMFTGGGADMITNAVLVETCQPHAGVRFANCQFFGDIVVAPANDGPVTFTGCGFFGTYKGTQGIGQARLDGRGVTSFDNCQFAFYHDQVKIDHLLHAVGGHLSVSHCTFLPTVAGALKDPKAAWPIVLGEGVASAQVMGNRFFNTADPVHNESKGQAIIAQNINV